LRLALNFKSRLEDISLPDVLAESKIVIKSCGFPQAKEKSLYNGQS